MFLTIIKRYFLQIWLNLIGFLYYFILWGPSSSQGYQQTYYWRKQWFLPSTAVAFSQAKLVANKDRRDESNVDVLKSCKQSWWSQQHWATADGRSGCAAEFQPSNIIHHQVSGPQTTGTKTQRQHWTNESSWPLRALDSSNILVRENLGTRIPVSLSG